MKADRMNYRNRPKQSFQVNISACRLLLIALWHCPRLCLLQGWPSHYWSLDHSFNFEDLELLLTMVDQWVHWGLFQGLKDIYLWYLVSYAIAVSLAPHCRCRPAARNIRAQVRPCTWFGLGSLQMVANMLHNLGTSGRMMSSKCWSFCSKPEPVMYAVASVKLMVTAMST